MKLHTLRYLNPLSAILEDFLSIRFKPHQVVILSSKSLVCLTSLLFSDCYKGIEFGLPNENPETDGFVNVSHSEIIARNEMDMVEKKFKEMGLPVDGEELDESDDGIRFGSFENLNDISHQEHHQNLPFRNDI